MSLAVLFPTGKIEPFKRERKKKRKKEREREVCVVEPMRKRHNYTPHIGVCFFSVPGGGNSTRKSRCRRGRLSCLPVLITGWTPVAYAVYADSFFQPLRLIEQVGAMCRKLVLVRQSQDSVLSRTISFLGDAAMKHWWRRWHLAVSSQCILMWPSPRP